MPDFHTPKLIFPGFFTSPFQVTKPQGTSLTRSPSASHPVFSQSLWPIFQTSRTHRPLPSPPPPTHPPTVTSQHISLPLRLPPSFPPQQPGSDAFKTQVRPHPSASHSTHLTHNCHQRPQTVCSVLWDPLSSCPALLLAPGLAPTLDLPSAVPPPGTFFPKCLHGPVLTLRAFAHVTFSRSPP